jgi:hypothetical protein
MGLGIEVRATFSGAMPEDPLAAVAAWAAQQMPDAEITLRREGIAYPSLLLMLHPAAEQVEISLVSPRTLQLTAQTSACGPGYHGFVVRGLMDPLAQALSLRWETPGEDEGGDETGYFNARDVGALEREMLAWTVSWASRGSGAAPRRGTTPGC